MSDFRCDDEWAEVRTPYEVGLRHGEHAAGRRCAKIIGAKVGAGRKAEQDRAATEDRRWRGALAAELGSSHRLPWEEIRKLIAELHRERYHFEAKARDAESKIEAMGGRPAVAVIRPEWKAEVDRLFEAWAVSENQVLQVPSPVGAAEGDYIWKKLEPYRPGGMSKGMFIGLTGLEPPP